MRQEFVVRLSPRRHRKVLVGDGLPVAAGRARARGAGELLEEHLGRLRDEDNRVVRHLTDLGIQFHNPLDRRLWYLQLIVRVDILQNGCCGAVGCGRGRHFEGE